MNWRRILLANKQEIDFRKNVTFLSRFREFPSYLLLATSTLLFNVLRIAFKIFSSFSRFKQNRVSPKIIIIGFGGIGNHLLLIPAIKMLHCFFPEARVYVMAASQASAELLNMVKDIDTVVIYKFLRSTWRAGQIGKGIKELKILKPDVVMGAAGLDPVFLSLVSFFSGARERIGADWRGRGFLLTKAVSLDGSQYEAKQNMKIAELLIGKPFSEVIEKQSLFLSEMYLQEGKKWKASLDLGVETSVVGIHPGSGNEQTWKRWKLEKFVELGRNLQHAYSCICVFFIGPDEEDIEKELIALDIPPKHILYETGSILKTASRIAQCRLFIANDSGLRQLAVSLGVPSIGIFGPTGTEKNYISLGIHEAVTAKHVLCSPCHYTRWWLACRGNQRCLDDITVGSVKSVAQRYLE